MRFAHAVLLCSLPMLMNGCETPPISTTLTDLIAESNDYELDPYVDFHENVSINGLLPQPQVGAHWYTADPSLVRSLWPEPWPPNLKAFVGALLGGGKRTSPAFGLGISAKLEDPSFWLYGETGTEVKPCEVIAVRNAIDAIQALTLEAVNVTVELAAARAGLRQVTGDTRLDPTTATARKDDLNKRIKTLEDKKTEVDKNLALGLKTYRDEVGKKPGIIVARWTARRSSAGSITTGLFDVGGSESKTISGYVILGGIRVSSLYFGDDFRSYLNIIEDADTLMFDQLDITTYMIQTKALAYTNSLDLQRMLTGQLSVRASSLGKIKDLISDLDKITISGYIATAMNLDNTGSLAEVKWYSRDRPMVEYEQVTLSDAEEKHLNALAKITDPNPNYKWYRVRPTPTFQLEQQNFEGLDADEAKAAATQPQELRDGEWLTVVAVSAKAPRINGVFRKAVKKGAVPKVAFDGELNYILLDSRALRSRRPLYDAEHNLIPPNDPKRRPQPAENDAAASQPTTPAAPQGAVPAASQ